MPSMIQALVIFACTGTPVAAPPEQHDAAPGHQNLALDLDNCMREVIQVMNVENPNKELDFRRPEVWMRAGAMVAMDWERKHPGWYIYRIKGPDPNTGKLPEGCPITIKCPFDEHNI
jgi:hypothetical protein